MTPMRANPKAVPYITGLFALSAALALSLALVSTQFWWPIAVVAVLWLFGTFITLQLQVKYPPSAQMLLRAYAGPSGCMLLLALILDTLARHHQISSFTLFQR
jgi:hypothetical protein